MVLPCSPLAVYCKHNLHKAGNWSHAGNVSWRSSLSHFLKNLIVLYSWERKRKVMQKFFVNIYSIATSGWGLCWYLSVYWLSRWLFFCQSLVPLQVGSLYTSCLFKKKVWGYYCGGPWYKGKGLRSINWYLILFITGTLIFLSSNKFKKCVR